MPHSPAMVMPKKPVGKTSPGPKPGKGNRSRRKGTRAVVAADRDRFVKIYAEVGNMAEVARRTGFSRDTVVKHLKIAEAPERSQFTPELELMPPKLWDQLTLQQRAWMVDFAAFRRHFFKRDTPPFQIEMANVVASGEHHNILALTPPGHGKTQCWSVDFPIWAMLRARCMGKPFSCMLVSKSENMAQAFLSQIKQELERNNPLADAYGRLKPEYPEMWRRSGLFVDGFPVRKEPTFIAAGAGSHIYGWRVELIVSDDIVDGENSGTPERAEKLAMWYADELYSRLNPDGVIVNVGTRFSSFDLHGKLWRKREDDGTVIWHPVIYRAHDDARCSGVHCEECKEGCVHDKPYPEGCVLWPARFGYRKLRRIRSGQTTSSRFEFLYNQYEMPDEDSLVHPEWITACKDKNRTVWDIPSGARVVCTLDPSPTMWAVAQVWAYSMAEEKSYLVAQHRQRRMQAPAYLTLIKDWTLKIRSMGFEPVWVVEVNAAQRWLLQSNDYQRMRSEIGLSMISHTTGRNKADPQYGVQSIGPQYEFGKISLPWGDRESQRQVQPLIDELQAYPMGETDDAIMAEWFHHWTIRRWSSPDIGEFSNSAHLPPYLNVRRELVDLRTGVRQAVG